MTTYKILYWQEIPTQIKAEDESEDVNIMLDGRFMAHVDILAAKRGLHNRRTTTWPSGSGAKNRSAMVLPAK